MSRSVGNKVTAIISDKMRKMINSRAVGNPGLTADFALLQVSEQCTNGSDKTPLGAASWDIGARSIQRHWSPP